MIVTALSTTCIHHYVSCYSVVPMIFVQRHVVVRLLYAVTKTCGSKYSVTFDFCTEKKYFKENGKHPDDEILPAFVWATTYFVNLENTMAMLQNINARPSFHGTSQN